MCAGNAAEHPSRRQRSLPVFAPGHLPFMQLPGLARRALHCMHSCTLVGPRSSGYPPGSCSRHQLCTSLRSTAASSCGQFGGMVASPSSCRTCCCEAAVEFSPHLQSGEAARQQQVGRRAVRKWRLCPPEASWTSTFPLTPPTASTTQPQAVPRRRHIWHACYCVATPH